MNPIIEKGKTRLYCSGPKADKLKILDKNGITGPHTGCVPIDLFKFSSSKYTYAGSQTKKLVSDLLKDIDKRYLKDAPIKAPNPIKIKFIGLFKIICIEKNHHVSQLGTLSI